MDSLTKLHNFNIGNLVGDKKTSCNKLKKTELHYMLKYKWEALENFDVECNLFRYV